MLQIYFLVGVFLLLEMYVTYKYSILILYSFTAETGSCTLRGGKLVSIIEVVGHTTTHFLHNLHFSSSMYAKLSVITIASCGQTCTHFVHAIQATSQFFFARAPLSLFIHAT